MIKADLDVMMMREKFLGSYSTAAIHIPTFSSRLNS